MGDARNRTRECAIHHLPPTCCTHPTNWWEIRVRLCHMQMIRLSLGWLLCFAASSVGAADELGPAVETVQIEAGELSVLFRDNSASPGILSGIQSLFNVRQAPGYDAFDPD